MGFLDAIWKNPEKETTADKKSPVINSNHKIPSKLNTAKNESFESSSINNVTAGSKRAEIVEYFKTLMKENNIPGPDFQEFVVALEDAKNDPSDEQTKVKGVFRGFKAMGVTVQTLIESAGKYKALFSSKLDAFNKDQDSEIQKKQSELDSLKAKNQQIDEQMKKLNDQKLENSNLSSQLNDEILEIGKRKGDFSATYDEIVKEIDSNIELINKHLS